MNLFGRSDLKKIKVLDQDVAITKFATAEDSSVPLVYLESEGNGGSHVCWYHPEEKKFNVLHEHDIMAMSASSEAHGVPIFAVVGDKAVIVDRFDQPDRVMESFNATKPGDLQSAILEYEKRLVERERALKAAASMSHVEPAR